MELGMIGLVRMGANMTERLVLGGHRRPRGEEELATCLVIDSNPECLAQRRKDAK